MLKTFKTKIRKSLISKETQNEINRNFGCTRLIYNKTLEWFYTKKKENGYWPTSWHECDKYLTETFCKIQKTEEDKSSSKTKKKENCFQYVKNSMITKNVIQNAEKRVLQAVNLCMNKKVQKKSHGKARPHFKTKRDPEQSFTLRALTERKRLQN